MPRLASIVCIAGTFVDGNFNGVGLHGLGVTRYLHMLLVVVSTCTLPKWRSLQSGFC